MRVTIAPIRSSARWFQDLSTLSSRGIGKLCGVYYASSPLSLALSRPSRRLHFAGVPLLGSKSGSHCESRRNPRSSFPLSSLPLLTASGGEAFEAAGRWRGAVIVLFFDSAALACSSGFAGARRSRALIPPLLRCGQTPLTGLHWNTKALPFSCPLPSPDVFEGEHCSISLFRKRKGDRRRTTQPQLLCSYTDVTV
ncbi:hypothetical protein QQF64_000665 [Cirrhinus molitorella]|uniref:Uncharacterized protein n=1 Tax=Cirrhinus molitorella TaxID=172907 RepID=A0ABR3NYG9_9TELE